MSNIELLFVAAKSAMDKAYAPYSKFQVGAAVLGSNGEIYQGANVENSSYPEGCCAEASAISAMVMGGEHHISAIAVIGLGDGLVTPCGGCRQRIREFASPETPIYILGADGLRETFTLNQLLPVSFGPDNLQV